MRRATTMLAAVLTVTLAGGCGGGTSGDTQSSTKPPDALLHPTRLTRKAPRVFHVTFHTTKGDFVLTVHRDWAPKGADRLYDLAKSHFFDGAKFFRVVPGFVVQFGISPEPAVSTAWRDATIPDDAVKAHNVRGAVSFAAAGPNTRTTQIFVNLGNNRRLDGLGFAPVGSVTSGMGVVDRLYSGYGEQPTARQAEMQLEGNAWLEKHYPKLDAIKSTSISGA
jgi:peptidyl-prolyl cis-trans isomerase A (cyclophilin A)